MTCNMSLTAYIVMLAQESIKKKEQGEYIVSLASSIISIHLCIINELEVRMFKRAKLSVKRE